MSADEFYRHFAAEFKGKTVLLYCSVGVRSSRLAQRINSAAQRAEAKGVFNVRGGVFAWHNYDMILRAAQNETELVHPYGKSWKAYLDFPNLASFGRNW